MRSFDFCRALFSLARALSQQVLARWKAPAGRLDALQGMSNMAAAVSPDATRQASFLIFAGATQGGPSSGPLFALAAHCFARGMELGLEPRKLDLAGWRADRDAAVAFDRRGPTVLSKVFKRAVALARLRLGPAKSNVVPLGGSWNESPAAQTRQCLASLGLAGRTSRWRRGWRTWASS